MTLPDDASLKIYVVFGRTGEYSDHREWPVDAWTTKRAAKARVARLSNRILEIGLSRAARYESVYPGMLAEMRKLDPSFQHDYTGTRYHIIEVNLRGKCEQV